MQGCMDVWFGGFYCVFGSFGVLGVFLFCFVCFWWVFCLFCFVCFFVVVAFWVFFKFFTVWLLVDILLNIEVFIVMFISSGNLPGSNSQLFYISSVLLRG